MTQMNLNHQLKILLTNIYHRDVDTEYVENWLGTHGAEIHSSDSELDRRVAGELEWVINEGDATNRSDSLVEAASAILKDIGLIGASIVGAWTPDDGSVVSESTIENSVGAHGESVTVGVQDSTAWADPIIV